MQIGTISTPNPEGITRRRLLMCAAGGFAGACLDQGLGHLTAEGLTTEPETDVASFNRATGRTVLVAGGIVNPNIGPLMDPGLNAVGTVAGISYAETNVDSDKLTESVEKTLDDNKLDDDTLDFYLNSAGGIFMAPTVRELARRGRRIGTIVLDSAPYDAHDVEGPLGFLIRIGAYRLGYSRLLEYMIRLGSDIVQDPATDKESEVSLALSEAYRQAQVDADTITYMNQAAAIRRGAPSDVLKGVSRRIIYAHSLNDPIINNTQAVQRWQQNADPGTVTEVIIRPPAFPSGSHAAGATHPGVIRELLLSSSH